MCMSECLIMIYETLPVFSWIIERLNTIAINSCSNFNFMNTLLWSVQVSHKLLIRCMGALKSGVKSGNAEHKATGDDEGMVKALVELASFCDEQLRLKEDEGH